LAIIQANLRAKGSFTLKLGACVDTIFGKIDKKEEADDNRVQSAH
jgi:hypothetical protein